MTRFALLFLFVLGGCDFGEGCLYDDVGCELPGDWQLVSIDGEAATGRWEIAEGFVERGGYGVVPTGNPSYPDMRGPFRADYSLDEDRPQGYDLTFWTMQVPTGTVYVDMAGRVESLDGNRMVYSVIRVESEIILNGGGSAGFGFPTLIPGTRLVFER